MVIGGRIYNEFESWMAKDFEYNWQQQQRTAVSSQSSAEDCTRDVGKRLLEFAKNSGRIHHQ